jgi:hypothetical protein
MNLQLSPSEVLAVAAHHRIMWPAAVVGVDYANKELLQDLVMEGTRSLVGRELFSVENSRLSVEPRFSGILEPVLFSKPVSALVGTAPDVAEVVGGAIYVYPAEQDCVAEVVRATGHRELLVLARPAAIGLIRTFVESVYRSTTVDVRDPEIVLYVGAPVGPSLPLTTVRPGRVSHGHAPAGHGPMLDSTDVNGGDTEWIGRLFEGRETARDRDGVTRWTSSLGRSSDLPSVERP